MDEIQTWWEIPSIVHFCNVFQPFCKDICPINIKEFEQAIEENSTLLTDMAIRFVKICGFYRPNTKEWWKIMQKRFTNKWIEYNTEHSLKSVTCFNDLTCKLKVKSLYTLCHMILDLPHIQKKISHKPELWHTFNVKPIGYDLNNSVYWYFGTTRLYREDFENTIDLSETSSTLYDTAQYHLSNTNIQKNLLCKPYPSGILGMGKWNIICDDIDSWHLLATNTQYSQNQNIRILHNSICNIITNLPHVKKHKSRYKYFDSSLQQELRNIHTRSLRSMFVDVNKNSKLLSNIDISKQDLQNIKIIHDEHSDLYSQLNKTNENKDTLRFNLNINEQKTFRNETKVKLKLKGINTINNTNIKMTNDFDVSNIHLNCLNHVTQVNNEYYEQENFQNFDNSKTNLRTSKRLKKKIIQPHFKDVNYQSF